jgi:dTDP-glucose 4,6-dehydratase
MKLMNKLSLQKKRILVTGGAGFMGSNFIRHLFKAVPGVSVINLDLLTYASVKENVGLVPRNRYRFIKGDICDTKLVRRLMKDVDFVVNFAAETHVDRSIHMGADNFLKTNVLGVHSLLEALRQSPKVFKLIHISTDEVWGSISLSSRKKFTEESPFRPNSPYAASKAAGDLLVRSYVQTYQLPVIVSHSTNNFGPFQFPEKMIPFFIFRAQTGQPIPLYGDGKYRRDWLYVDDHSEAIVVLLERGCVGEDYAIAREGREYSNLGMARMILKILSKPKNLITYVADRPGHDRRYAVFARKLRALGWKPKHDVETALHETVKWYEENSAWLSVAKERVGKLNPHIKT